MKPPAKRKSTGKSRRFDIFNRDGFTCRYCGNTSADAKLVLDHIVPVSAGGSSDPENLITSCEICNQGKSDKNLTVKPPQPDNLALAQELRERIEAANLAHECTRAKSELRQALVNFWCEQFGIEDTQKTTASILLNASEEFGVESVYDWIFKAASKTSSQFDGIRYFCGIVRHRREEIEQGVVDVC